MMEILEQPCNPSSVHRYGRAARAGIEQARTRLAEALSVFPREIIFTSSGTEANNWVLRNTPATRVFIGATEHSSVQKGSDGEVSLIPVDANGVLKLDALEAMLKDAGDEQVLVSVMLGNNETGVIHPVAAKVAAVDGDGLRAKVKWADSFRSAFKTGNRVR
jgi:cysteine desulfurase